MNATHDLTETLRALCLVFGLASLAAHAGTPLPPDPAAHTVLVPFDPAQPLQGQKPQRYYLDRAEFDKLWALAKKNRTPEKVIDKDDEAPSATLHSALYQASIEDERLSIVALYEVSTRGHWAKTNLAISDGTELLPPRDLMVDGKPGAMVKGEVTFEQPGHHTVQVTFDLMRPRNWKQAALNLPPARAAMLSLKPAEHDAMPVFGDGKLVAVEETVNGVRTITVGLGSATKLQLGRVQRRTVNATPPPSAEVNITTSLTGEMRLHGVVQTRFVFPGSARKEVALAVDPDWSLDGVPGVTSGGSPVRDMRVSFRDEAGKPTLVATFPHEVSDEVTLDLHLTPKSIAISHTPFIAPRAAKWESIARLIAQDGVQLIAKPTATQQRLANEDYSYEKQTIPVIRYRLSGGDTLLFDTKPADSKTAARIDYVYQLSEQKQELAAAITLTRERGAWRQLRLTLPPGMEMQSVQSPQLIAWELEGSQLFLRFNDATTSTAKVVVYVANASLQPTKLWALKPLALADLGKVQGSALVAAHAAVEARLEGFQQAPDLREIDPATLTSTFTLKSPLEKKRAIEFERADWTLNVGVQEQPVRFVVDGVMLTQATDLGVLLSQQIAISVEAGALKKVIVRLPKSLPEATVSGELLRESQSRIAGELREYECTFQSQGGLLGKTALTFDMQLPLTDAELAVPFVEVADAERLRRFFVLDNSSSRESKLLQSDGVDAAAKDSLPYLPNVVTQPQYYQGRPSGGLKVAFSQLQASGGNAAIVTLADITTVLRADGERWDTVMYSLSNRSLQFLPVVLPDKAELIAVNVSGEAVRADEELRQGRRVRLIPLIQTRAGQRSMEVRLVYRIKGSTLPKKVKLDDPELVGISAERTVWTASLPKGWTLDDAMLDSYGNMEPIPEEGREIEKLQSWMSDLSRLNRVMSTSKDLYENKMACAEADKLNKQIDEVTKRMESKRNDSRLYEKPQGDSKRQQKFAEQTENDLGQVKKELGKQVLVFNDNKSNVGKLEVQQANALTLQNRNGGNDLETNGRVRNGWSFNGLSQTAPPSNSSSFLPTPAGPVLDLNDNIGIAGDFFDGTLVLGGMSTYTGATTITARTIQVGAASGTLVAGTGGIAKSGAGTLALDVPAQLQVSANNAQQPVFSNRANVFGFNSNARASGTTITSGGTLNFNGGSSLSNSSTLSNVSQGSGNVVTGSNTYTGGVNIATDVFGGTPPTRGLRFGTATISPDSIDGLVAGKPQSSLVAPDKVTQILQDDASKARMDLGLPAAAAPPMPAPADPFAAAATPSLTASAGKTLNTATLSSSASTVGGNTAGIVTLAPGQDAAGVVLKNDGNSALRVAPQAGAVPSNDLGDSLGVVTAAVNQLRPTGRRSLQVEVPVGGEVFHFRKLRDHAVLDLSFKRVTPEGRTAQATFLGISLGVWALIALFVSRRRK